MLKQVVLLTLVVGCSALLGAQTPTIKGDIAELVDMNMSTAENVLITADRAELNQKSGEMRLFGIVTLRQELRPAAQPIAATNQAGAPFPAPRQVMLRLSGNFQVSIGDLNVRADEADVNGLTGEMTLRGNVRATNPRWAGQKLQWAQ